MSFATLKKIFDATGLDVNAALIYLEKYEPDYLIQNWNEIKKEQQEKTQKYKEESEKLIRKRNQMYEIKNIIQNSIPKVGFWSSETIYNIEKKQYVTPDPEAQNCISPNWSKTTEANNVINYMQNSQKFTLYRGGSINRITGKPLEGSADMIGPDGKYIFPEKWEIYIIEHDIKPNNINFINHCIQWQQNQYHAQWVKEWKHTLSINNIKEINIPQLIQYLQQEGIIIPND